MGQVLSGLNFIISVETEVFIRRKLYVKIGLVFSLHYPMVVCILNQRNFALRTDECAARSNT